MTWQLTVIISSIIWAVAIILIYSMYLDYDKYDKYDKYDDTVEEDTVVTTPVKPRR
jgi:hypothetical protein